MYLRRVRVVGRTFAATLALVSTPVTPHLPVAHKLGVDFTRPCRGKECGGLLGAIARIAPAAKLRQTTQKVIRREDYLTTVQIKPAMFTLLRCTLAEMFFFC
jgi:hypothetical protein